MHIQARLTGAASPADLTALLDRLAEPSNGSDPINIEGVAGDHLETGGKFIFAFDHDRVDDVRAVLAAYKDLEIVEGDLALIDAPASTVGGDDELHVRVLGGNSPGQLRAAIRDAAAANIVDNRLVKHVLIGQETQAPNRFYVQVTFQEVRHP